MREIATRAGHGGSCADNLPSVSVFVANLINIILRTVRPQQRGMPLRPIPVLRGHKRCQMLRHVADLVASEFAVRRHKSSRRLPVG